MVTPPTLQAWINEHGPLGAHEAATVASLCGSHMLRQRPGRDRWHVADLDAQHIVRGESGLWEWKREPMARLRLRESERDAVVALGRLLHSVLTASSTPAGVSAASSLRRLRPELPASLDALATRALAGDISMAQLLVDLQSMLGVAPARWRWPPSMIWTGVVAAALAGLFAIARPSTEPLSRDPDTGVDARVVDSLWEKSFGLAWMDEQSAAAAALDALERLETDRAGRDSPLRWWELVWLAWLRQQLGDYLTAEQAGGPAAERLPALLGADHPYAIAAGIVHTSTLQQRGAWADAAAVASTVWRSHIARLGIAGSSPIPTAIDPSTLHTLRFDSDRDGDGLGDLVEHLLGTPPDLAATATETVGGRPARSYALPLNPRFVVAHVAGRPPWAEGFLRRPRDGDAAWSPMFVLPSVQRGYAERYGWLLVMRPGPASCSLELDTGTAPRRLRVEMVRQHEGWVLEESGTRRVMTSVTSADDLVADYDSTTRTVTWWWRGEPPWVTKFDDLEPSGAGPYGLRLTATSADACASVTWVLRRAEIAPM